MKKQLTRQSINSVCIGYSGNSHWEFFKMVLGKPWIKNICVLGVYYGRDIAYMANILNSLGRDDYQIVGVDKFEDSYCDDWPEEQRNLTWEEAGFGPAPTLNKTKANLFELGLATIDSQNGLELTKRIAEKFNLNLKICVGCSPEDVPSFLGKVLAVGGTIDFVFVDGLHTNEQVFRDFHACLPYLSDSAILAFHDILNWNMLSGWQNIVESGQKHNFKAVILRRTASGMGMLYRNVSYGMGIVISDIRFFIGV